MSSWKLRGATKSELQIVHSIFSVERIIFFSFFFKRRYPAFSPQEFFTATCLFAWHAVFWCQDWGLCASPFFREDYTNTGLTKPYLFSCARVRSTLVRCGCNKLCFRQVERVSKITGR